MGFKDWQLNCKNCHHILAKSYDVQFCRENARSMHLLICEQNLNISSSDPSDSIHSENDCCQPLKTNINNVLKAEIVTFVNDPTNAQVLQLKMRKNRNLHSRGRNPFNLFCMECDAKVGARGHLNGFLRLHFLFSYDACLCASPSPTGTHDYSLFQDARKWPNVLKCLTDNNLAAKTTTLQKVIAMYAMSEEQIEKEEDITFPLKWPSAEYVEEKASEIGHCKLSKLRDYQIELVIGALLSNTLIYLPTGSGKTLIAVKVMEEFAVLNPNRIAVLFVPTRPLVQQQAQYIRRESDLTVFELMGQTASLLRDVRRMREKMLLDPLVALVITPQLFMNLLYEENLRLLDVSVLIFDEAHHAIAKHPYAEILNALNKFPECDRPRMVGLSASPYGNKAGENSGHAFLQQLLSAYNASLDTPSLTARDWGRNFVPKDAQWIIVEVSARERNLREAVRNYIMSFDAILGSVCPNISSCLAKLDFDTIESSRTLLAGRIRSTLVGTDSVSAKTKLVCKHVLGILTAFQILPIIGAADTIDSLKIRFKQLQRNGASVIHRDLFTIVAPAYQAYIEPLIAGENNNEMLREELATRVTLIAEMIQKMDIRNDSRGIVFVRTRHSARLIASVMAKIPSLRMLNPTKFVGQNHFEGMSWEQEQKPILAKFRQGQIRLLVATNVLEEGIDVPECTFVIRFDGVAGIKSLIQSRGRARCRYGSFLILCTETEKRSQENLMRIEENMVATARLLAACHPSKRIASKILDMESSFHYIPASAEAAEEDAKACTEKLSWSFVFGNFSQPLVENAEFEDNPFFKDIRSQVRVSYVDKSICLCTVDVSDPNVSMYNAFCQSIQYVHEDTTYWTRYESSIKEDPVPQSNTEASIIAPATCTLITKSVLRGCLRSTSEGTRIFTSEDQILYDHAPCSVTFAPNFITVDPQTDDEIVFHVSAIQNQVCYLQHDPADFTVSLYITFQTPPYFYKSQVRYCPDLTFKPLTFCFELCVHADSDLFSLRACLHDAKIEVRDTMFRHEPCPIPVIDATKELALPLRAAYALQCFYCRIAYLFGEYSNSEFMAELTDLHPDCIEQILLNFEPNSESCPVQQLKEFVLKETSTYLASDSPFYDISTQGDVILQSIVTPTRILYLPPLTATMNRVFRHFGAQNFMNIHFRDDNCEKLDMKHPPVLERLLDFFEDGVSIAYYDGAERKIAQFQFVGCSMSQVREFSCIFTSLDPIKIREWIGYVEPSHTPASFLKRLSRAFTTTLEAFQVSPSIFENPKEDIRNEHYMFTDGCGEIGSCSAQAIADSLDMDKTPSAFQIRVGGAKGVVVISNIHENNHESAEFVKQNGIVLRQSMIKFQTDHNMLEIVYASGQSPAYLSRQSIQLLSDLKISDQVFIELQEEYLASLRKLLASESSARIALKQVLPEDSKRHLESYIANGMSVFDDEYLRCVLHASYSYKIHNVVQRARILVPQGRIMLGVADFTQTLQYGQVFVRYTDDDYDTRESQTHTLNDCLVTVYRNPCHHPGDIRVLRCRADVPEQLSRLVDVIVFPTVGPRPHPDECSGGDLDGDMYSVIWDERLIPEIDDVTDPMSYIVEDNDEYEIKDITQSLLTQTYIDMAQNSVLGAASNAHLALCDYSESGSFDTNAQKLAWICSQEVDGLCEKDHLQTVRELAPPAYPDFMEQDRKSYRSNKILGKLYRASKILMKLDKSFPIEELLKVNDDYLIGNYVAHLHGTKILYNNYCRAIDALMRMSGAQIEGELASGLVITADDLFRADYFRFGLRCKESFCKLGADYRRAFTRMSSDLDDAGKLELAAAWYYTPFSCKERKIRHMSFTWIIMDQLLINKALVDATSRSRLQVVPSESLSNFMAKLQVSMISKLELSRNSILSEYFDRLHARTCIECAIAPLLPGGAQIITFGSSAILLNEKVSDIDLMIHSSEPINLHTVKSIVESTMCREASLKEDARVPILKFVYDRWNIEVCTHANGPLKTRLFREYATRNAFFWPCLYYLLKWGRCAAFVKRDDKKGENYFSPTTFTWFFIQFCISKDYMKWIAPYEVNLKTLIDTSNDLNAEVSFWNTQLKDIILNSPTSRPSPGEVFWEFLNFYANESTPESSYSCEDPFNPTNDTQLNERSIEGFRAKCTFALHQLLLDRGKIDCLLVRDSNHTTRIILSRPLSRRILCNPNFFAKKLLIECEAIGKTKLNFTTHSNQLRKHLIVAEITGDCKSSHAIEEKLEAIEKELGGLIKLERPKNNYFRENAGLLLFEGALSQDEKIGFYNYFKDCNLCHEDMPLHQAELLCYVHGKQWYKHAAATFQTKFMQQMIKLGHFSETYPNALHPKAIIRFGYHYLIHLPRSFHDETLLHATIQGLDEEFERGRVAYDLYKEVLIEKAQLGDQDNKNDIGEPAEANAMPSERRDTEKMNALSKVVARDRGVTHSFYPKVQASLMPAVLDYLDNHKKYVYTETTSSYTVSIVYRSLEYAARLDSDLQLISLRSRPCRWFCTTLKMRQELDEATNSLDFTPDVRYYVSTSEDMNQEFPLYAKLLAACENAPNKQGILIRCNDSAILQISPHLIAQGIKATSIPNARSVSGKTYVCKERNMEILVLDVFEFSAPVVSDLEQGFHRTRHKLEIEVYMPPFDVQTSLSPSFAESFLRTGVELSDFMRSYATLSNALQEPNGDVYGDLW